MANTRTAAVRRETMGGLAKGLAVIRAFGRDHAALSLSDIARGAGMPAATARRCLLTLEELGYVTRNAPHLPAAAQGAGTRGRVPRIDQYRAAHPHPPGGARARDVRFGCTVCTGWHADRVCGAHLGAHAWCAWRPTWAVAFPPTPPPPAAYCWRASARSGSDGISNPHSSRRSPSTPSPTRSNCAR